MASTDLLIPYKKVSYLPAYFYKVFIKKKKASEEKKDNGQKGIDTKNAKTDEKKGKPEDKKDPKAANNPQQLAKPGEENIKDVINTKTKKLMDQMKEDELDYQREVKIPIEQIHKMVTEKSRIGQIFERYNQQKHRYVEKLNALKEKNNNLKKFDELEDMLNSYEQSLFHQHLFTDAHESHLTKLDLYYANQHYVYNEGLVSVDLQKTINIQYMCEHLVVTPFALILDRLLTVDGYQVLDLYTTYKDIMNQNITLYFFVPFIFAALICVRPIA